MDSENTGLNYYQTFIRVAPDCPVVHAVIPTPRGAKKPIHLIQYELLTAQPYTYTQEDLLFAVHVRHKEIPTAELETRGEALRAEFFQKSHACLRASALPKKYGWGIHFDAAGKIALYPMESSEYARFVETNDDGLQVLPAMRSRRV